MGAGHSHGGAETEGVAWALALRQPGFRAVGVVLIIAAVLTSAAVIALWPSGNNEALENEADRLGLDSKRYPATVVTVSDGRCSYSTAENPSRCRSVVIVPKEGPDSGDEVFLGEYPLDGFLVIPDFSVGGTIIAGYEPDTDFYFYADQDRRSVLAWLVVAFAVVVIALGRWRGVLALVAMALTVVVLVAFVAPSVLDGNDPLLVSVVAASAIAFISLYLTHGFTPLTTVALTGTIAALGVTLALASLFWSLADFSGLATEEAGFLTGISANLDLPALLLGGAILGALGALDDVTVTQVATVNELRLRSPDISRGALVSSGIRVGREHIASTVNTLLLAYVGAAMPLLLILQLSNQPLQMVANSELIAVEIVRTLTGSIGLVAAVPVTTALAAAVMTFAPQTEGQGIAEEEADDQSQEPSWPVQPPDAEDRAEDVEAAEPPHPPASWDDFAPGDDTERF